METGTFRLKLFLCLLLFVMLLGTVAFAFVENLSLLDAFYFSIVTIATVGYGDIYPRTIVGKILSIALITCGVGTFLEVIAGITQVMIKRRDRELRQEKLNMIVGLFFSELGTSLLRSLSEGDPNRDSLAEELSISVQWKDQQFAGEAELLARHSYQVEVDSIALMELKSLLEKKGDLLMRLLENPTLLEHEAFTELMRAIFHLRDELLHRSDFARLPEADKNHLSADMGRIYGQLIQYWLNYMNYLKKNYPYLFSLAVRTNPFNRSATAVISD